MGEGSDSTPTPGEYAAVDLCLALTSLHLSFSHYKMRIILPSGTTSIKGDQEEMIQVFLLTSLDEQES